MNHTVISKIQNREHVVIPIFFIILFIIISAIAISAPVHRWGDTSTYYMQIQSIAYDQDIVYSPDDIRRVMESEDRFDNLPAGLFLINNAGTYIYGKEYVYPLFAAPFYLILGNSGIIFLNGLFFILMVLMGYLFLKRENPAYSSLLISLSFFTLSVIVVYLFWIHTEIFNMFLLTGGIFLWTTYNRRENYYALTLSAMIFGIAIISKTPNLVIIIPILLYHLLNQEYKKTAVILLVTLITIISFLGFFYLNSGEFSFKDGDRLYYTTDFPYWNEAEPVDKSTGSGTKSVIDIPDKQADIIHAIWGFISLTTGRITYVCNNFTLVTLSGIYFIFGRFTGLLWYYPLALFAIIMYVLNRTKTINHSELDTRSCQQYIKQFIQTVSERDIIFCGILLTIVLSVAYMPTHYLGGQHAVGNRWFYLYPAFLFIIGKVNFRVMIPFLIIAAITLTPILSDPIRTSIIPYEHTFKFPYNQFPIEYTQLGHSYGYNNTTLVMGHLSLAWNAYHLSDTTIFPTTNVKKNGTFSYELDSDSEFLIYSQKKIDDYQFFIQSYAQDSAVDIQLGDSKKSIPNTSKMQIIKFDNISSEYSDNRYNLYKLTIHPAGKMRISFIPGLKENRPKNLIIDPINSGWHAPEKTHQWMTDNATLYIYSEKPGPGSLRMHGVSSYHSDRTLIIRQDRNLIGEYPLSPTASSSILCANISLTGLDAIQFQIPDGCEIPLENGNSDDNRCLGLYVNKMDLEISQYNF
jgi:hypothetical protein